MDVIAYTLTAFGVLIMVVGLIMAVISATAWMFASYNRAHKRQDRTARHTHDTFAATESQIGRDLADMHFSFSPSDQAAVQDHEKTV